MSWRGGSLGALLGERHRGLCRLQSATDTMHVQLRLPAGPRVLLALPCERAGLALRSALPLQPGSGQVPQFTAHVAIRARPKVNTQGERVTAAAAALCDCRSAPTASLRF